MRFQPNTVNLKYNSLDVSHDVFQLKFHLYHLVKNFYYMLKILHRADLQYINSYKPYSISRFCEVNLDLKSIFYGCFDVLVGST